MFRPIRRKRQELDERECLDVLRRGEWGTLALHGDDGYPYAVPINYVLSDGCIYFHSAREGHKIDAVRRNDKASFCVVDKSDLVPSEFTAYFRSVIVFGRIEIVEDPDEKARSLAALVEALSGGESEQSKRDELARCHMRDNVDMLRLSPEHISGKQAKELVK